MKRTLLICTLAGLLAACGDNDQAREQSLDQREQELQRREQALNQTKDAKPAPEAVSAELSNVEKLIGNWFVPHNAQVNIQFARDGRFTFHDYNSEQDEDQILTGKYELKNGALSMLYDDRPKQTFKFYKGEKGDANFYIRHGDYYFVKGQNGAQP